MDTSPQYGSALRIQFANSNMAASEYSNARAMARRVNPGNTTQRSWSNYVGDRPIKSKVGSSFYGNSPMYGPADGQDIGMAGGAVGQATAPAGLKSPEARTKDFGQRWDEIQSRETEWGKLNPSKTPLGRAKKAMEGGYVGPIV